MLTINGVAFYSAPFQYFQQRLHDFPFCYLQQKCVVGIRGDLKCKKKWENRNNLLFPTWQWFNIARCEPKLSLAIKPLEFQHSMTGEREMLPNKDFSRVPLIKPSMPGHRFLHFASVDYFVWNPRRSLWGYNSGVSARKWNEHKEQCKSQGNTATPSCSCGAAQRQGSENCGCTRQQDLCLAWFRQELP